MNKVLFCFLFIGQLLFSACVKKEGCTNTDACNFDADAQKDDGSCILQPSDMRTSFVSTNIDFQSGGLGGFCSGLNVNSDLNFDPFNFAICSGASGIIDVGAVTCLGEIKTIPGSGFIGTAGAVVNHGYVLRLKDGTHVRFVCAGWQTSTSGGVTGVKLEWQHPF